ncbi:MAG TPA: 3-hydroxyacyl-CoA dehydrogenase NAD-binding domain-containing protein [Vicinamibacterales bacterium]|jgi:3-hydroxyacyl-CoA dehydrogenase
MTPLVTYTTRNGVALIHINNPPVNALTTGVPEGLASSITRADNDPAVRAVVVMGAGRTFIAGADIKELERAAHGDDSALPNLHALLQRIEDCSKPVVMALHGTALGGGLEVAMAGHYRVAVHEARMGQPEVNLGIIPGAEGTQRLPRLVGVAKAIEMCVSGKPIGAADALQAGLVDRLIDGDLESGAIQFASEIAAQPGPHPKTRERRDKIGEAIDESLFVAGRDLARKTRRNMLAPLAVIDAIEAAARLPFDQGCRREREVFTDCVRSEQAKALIHAFFAERGVSKVPDVPKDTRTLEIRKVAIIGAGTMGGGIAMACANAGIPVILKDASKQALDTGMATIRRNYETSVTRGRFTTAVVEERIASIHPQIDYDGCETADLVIEAVFESMALKKAVFAELDRVAKPGCILATNTSTLDVDEIASTTRRPESVIGLHFFSPANVMRLVEIVRGAKTSAEVIATAMALAKRLGKVGVLVGNCPGFVGNRMMFPYMYEAQFLVEDGATPEQVDRTLTEWGMAMGIFAVDDMAGLDVAWRVRQELRQFQDAGMRKPLVADELYELGRLGQKSGKGWYRYTNDRKPIPDPEVLELIERTTAAAGIRRRAFAEPEILERTIYALINEGARVLDEGFALRAADIDVIYMNGYGFPAYRGGPMFYADRVGLPRIFDRVSTFHRQLGQRWEPAPLLARLVQRGKGFADFDADRDVRKP